MHESPQGTHRGGYNGFIPDGSIASAGGGLSVLGGKEKAPGRRLVFLWENKRRAARGQLIIPDGTVRGCPEMRVIE
jgi:hypothetical protein